MSNTLSAFVCWQLQTLMAVLNTVMTFGHVAVTLQLITIFSDFQRPAPS